MKTVFCVWILGIYATLITVISFAQAVSGRQFLECGGLPNYFATHPVHLTWKGARTSSRKEGARTSRTEVYIILFVSTV